MHRKRGTLAVDAGRRAAESTMDSERLAAAHACSRPGPLTFCNWPEALRVAVKEVRGGWLRLR